MVVTILVFLEEWFFKQLNDASIILVNFDNDLIFIPLLEIKSKALESLLSQSKSLTFLLMLF